MANRKTVAQWWLNASDKVKSATYIEQYLGANEKSSVYLKVNTKPHPTTIFRVGRRAFTYLKLEPLESQFLNVRYYRIVALT